MEEGGVWQDQVGYFSQFPCQTSAESIPKRTHELLQSLPAIQPNLSSWYLEGSCKTVSKQNAKSLSQVSCSNRAQGEVMLINCSQPPPPLLSWVRKTSPGILTHRVVVSAKLHGMERQTGKKLPPSAWFTYQHGTKRCILGVDLVDSMSSSSSLLLLFMLQSVELTQGCVLLRFGGGGMWLISSLRW